jgi:hypothetical protein
MSRSGKCQNIDTDVLEVNSQFLDWHLLTVYFGNQINISRPGGFRLALKVHISNVKDRDSAINESRRSIQCRHKTNLRCATAINTVRLQPVRTVKGSFVTNSGVKREALTFGMHSESLCKPIT